jgi:hypothetical protein
MIYTALCVMLLMRAASITRASGRRLGPENRDFFGPREMTLSRLASACYLGPKKVQSSNITALVRLSNITSLLSPILPPQSRTYQKSTGNCKVHKGTLWYIKKKQKERQHATKPYNIFMLCKRITAIYPLPLLQKRRCTERSEL